MSIVERFENAIQEEITGTGITFTNLLDDILHEKCESKDLETLAVYIQKRFFSLEIKQRISVLFLLGKINPERAHFVARQDLANAHDRVRVCASYLQQIIISIDDSEHFLRSLSAIEVEKALRISYALINDLEIIEGDFMPPAKGK